MKIKLALSLLVFLLSACATQPKLASASEDTTAANSGIKGQALIGPTCPVMTVESPCPDKPYQASFTVLRLDGQEVTRFETDVEGRFEIKLPPGDYILHPESPTGKMIPTAADVPFTVNPDDFTELIVSFDSGIR